MDERLLSEKLESAKLRISDARSTIETLLSEIRVLPRAEKMTISSTVEDAFEKLRDAQADLQELELLIARSRRER
jgi:hypothetical protein